jgi:hypothetical protein
MSAALMRIETGGGLRGGLDSNSQEERGTVLTLCPLQETESRKAQSRQNRRINSRRAL